MNANANANEQGNNRSHHLVFLFFNTLVEEDKFSFGTPTTPKYRNIEVVDTKKEKKKKRSKDRIFWRQGRVDRQTINNDMMRVNTTCADVSGKEVSHEMPWHHEKGGGDGVFAGVRMLPTYRRSTAASQVVEQYLL